MADVADKADNQHGVGGRDPEAFGQLGVRQFLVPAVSVVMLFIAGLSAVMWYRSFDTTDMFTRRIGSKSWAVYSIYGRMLVTRTDLSPSAGSINDTGWQYGALPVPDVVEDLWAPSWRKTLGVEWRAQPLGNNPIIVDGWWLRIRWRTVLVLSAILPIARAIRDWRKSRARRIPGFEVVAASGAAREWPSSAARE